MYPNFKAKLFDELVTISSKVASVDILDPDWQLLTSSLKKVVLYISKRGHKCVMYL